MKPITNFVCFILLLCSTSVLNSCHKIDEFFHHGKPRATEGYVYTSTNNAGTNGVMIFKQEVNGELSYKSTVASGGAGRGMGLGSQGAIAIDKNHLWLYTVNAGNNTISSFKISQDGNLQLHQTINSGGATPVSLTVHNSWLYVVNSGSICGFKIDGNGDLSKIAGSSQPLSSPGAMPAEILFKPDGSLLLVTEKATNKIAVYKLSGDGVAQPGMFYPAHAETPFGFVFAGNNHIVVTNAFRGMPNQSTVSSLAVSLNAVDLVSNISTNQTAACWVVLSKKEDYAFATNTGSNSITSLAVQPDGRLTLIDSAAAKTGRAPTDIILSGNGEFIYNVNQMSGTISKFRVLPNGTLHPIGDVSGLTRFAAGLVAF